MNIFENATIAVMKRPFIIILIGALMLAAAVVNAFIPVVAMIVGIINMTGGGVFEAVLSILQMLLDPAIIVTTLIILAVLTLLISAAAGLLLPGYLLGVDDGLENGRKKKDLFLKGLKENFVGFFLITLRVVPITAVLALFLMVAGVPAIVVTKAAFSTRPNLLLASVFIDIVTVGVLLMSLSFFKAYIYMWYLSAVKGIPKPFRYGKSIADRCFWKLALSLLAFDAVFVLILFGIYLCDSQIFRYAAGWVFATGFFTTLAVYLVQVFRDADQNAGKAAESIALEEDAGEDAE